MTSTEPRPPVSPGEPAPDFTLPAVDGKEPVSLSDYRGQSPVFLALLLGLWCPFCRRQIAQMGATEAKLKAIGVETLGIVATAPENARLYFKFRPTRLRLAADPELTTHRAYRPAEAGRDPGVHERARDHADQSPSASFPSRCRSCRRSRPSPRLDGYAENDTDSADMERQFPQLKGQFLIDRDGIVRWANIECATEGLAGLGKFPSDEEILAAVRALPRR